MKPDTRKVTYMFLKQEEPPKIFFSQKALKWIKALVDAHDIEVGFIGVVDKEKDGSYTIRDIFYPKHSEANGATCEISPEGEGLIMEYLIEKNRVNDILNMTLWGHSHVNMGTAPSGQDETQAIERMGQTKSILIRIICNKSDEISVSFFDYQRKIRFDNIKWEVRETNDSNHYEELINSIIKITEKKTNCKKKFSEIERVINSDLELEHIKEKIAELKKENIPKLDYTIINPHHSRSGFQYEYPKQDNNWTGRYYQDRWENPKKSDIPSFNNNIDIETDETASDEEISRMLKRWEEESF